MITASQLLAHLWGDYILQSDWMAQNKTKAFIPAAVHAVTYSLLFLLFRPSLMAFAIILGTHFLIDRYRLARYVVWAKNWLAPFERKYISEIQESHWIHPNWPLEKCPTGYPPCTPDWLAVWLLIIADNILHITINGLALRFF